MYRSNRLEAHEELGCEFAFSTPNFPLHPYNSIISATDCSSHLPPRPRASNYASILPGSHEGTSPPNLLRSTGPETKLPVPSTGLTSPPVGHVQGLHGGFDISAGSQCMLPLDNQSLLSNALSNGPEGYEMGSSYVAPKNFPSPINLRGYFAPNHLTPAEHRNSYDINSTGILNDDLQMPMSESFFFGQSGRYLCQSFIAEDD